MHTTTPPKKQSNILVIPAPTPRLTGLKRRQQVFGDRRIKRQGTRRARFSAALAD